MIRILCFLAVIFAILMLWIAVAEHRTDNIMEYGDCIEEHRAGTSIPAQDAWVIFHDQCKK